MRKGQLQPGISLPSAAHSQNCSLPAARPAFATTAHTPSSWPPQRLPASLERVRLLPSEEHLTGVPHRRAPAEEGTPTCVDPATAARVALEPVRLEVSE